MPAVAVRLRQALPACGLGTEDAQREGRDMDFEEWLKGPGGRHCLKVLAAFGVEGGKTVLELAFVVGGIDQAQRDRTLIRASGMSTAEAAPRRFTAYVMPVLADGRKPSGWGCQ